MSHSPESVSYEQKYFSLKTLHITFLFLCISNFNLLQIIINSSPT